MSSIVLPWDWGCWHFILHKPAIGLLTGPGGASADEIKLATRLRIPLISPADLADSSLEYYLSLATLGLCLFQNTGRAPGAVLVDFTSPALNFRIDDSAKNQQIIKAVGAKGAVLPKILDATAGLGKDAYLLASRGCAVMMLERSIIIHAMLEDGLRRAQKSEARVATIAAKLELQLADFLSWDNQGQEIDVVYLDPMFPQGNRSARVKKDMFLLQGVLGHGVDEKGLLEKALTIASNRVVVKRAKSSPYLCGLNPSMEFKGGSSRYDVYLSNQPWLIEAVSAK